MEDQPHEEQEAAAFEEAEYVPEATFAINEPAWDIGHLASWTLSSAKPDHGIEALRAPQTDRYWQSFPLSSPSPTNLPGPMVHNLINSTSSSQNASKSEFPALVRSSNLEWISMYLDYFLDESYTPSKIAIYAGTGLYDLTEVKTLDLTQPRGWQTVNVGDFGRGGVIKAFLVQISILTNHQNGKDTHLRGVKIFAPGTEYSRHASNAVEGPFFFEEQNRIFSIR